MLSARQAISLVFFVNGFTLANWIARIPAISGGLGLSEGAFGTALLGLAVGAIGAFPFAGRLIGDFGSARITMAFGLALTLSLPPLALAPNLPLLFLALVFAGASNGGMDVSMNAQGVEVERVWERPILNSMHGFFSLGGFAGAGTGAAAAALDVDPLPHFLLMTLVGLAALLWARTALIDDDPSAHVGERAPVYALPPRALLPLGLVVACAAIGEGAMADWSALYLRESRGTDPGVAALGFAAFSVAMLSGRFTNDALVARFGPERILRAGGSIAAVGLALGLLVNTVPAVMLGFAAVGLGLAGVFPLGFSAAADRPGIARGRSVAAVATMGYTGFLAGPPLLGWVAELTSLRLALGIVVLLAAAIVVLAGVTRRPATEPTPHSLTAHPTESTGHPAAGT
ncbi:MAG: MFS transporter [Chloroflexia bacterium]|nr:MFS transporter [Chloroflexia bacterium]